MKRDASGHAQKSGIAIPKDLKKKALFAKKDLFGGYLLPNDRFVPTNDLCTLLTSIRPLIVALFIISQNPSKVSPMFAKKQAEYHDKTISVHTCNRPFRYATC